mgnify:CR=1 FL=1
MAPWGFDSPLAHHGAVGQRLTIPHSRQDAAVGIGGNRPPEQVWQRRRQIDSLGDVHSGARHAGPGQRHRHQHVRGAQAAATGAVLRTEVPARRDERHGSAALYCLSLRTSSASIRRRMASGP